MSDCDGIMCGLDSPDEFSDTVRVCGSRTRHSGGSSSDSQSFEEKSHIASIRRNCRTLLRETVSNGSHHSSKSSSPCMSYNGATNGTENQAFRDLSWEVLSLREEVENLRKDLAKSRNSLREVLEREQKLKDRLAEQAQRMLERGMHFENVCLGDKRPTALIRRYGNLYAQARVDTLDALDSLPELREADELKSKLLFSVVVLAFRSIQNAISDIKFNVRKILQMPDSLSAGNDLVLADSSVRELEGSINVYLRSTIDRFEVGKSVEEVCTQIWATLYDYPCLKTCEGLVHYVRDCVRLAWGLSTQLPPFVIEYETRTFRRDMHVRFHTSNQESDHIKTYLWPALLEGENGPCVHKGVVVT